MERHGCQRCRHCREGAFLWLLRPGPTLAMALRSPFPRHMGTGTNQALVQSAQGSPCCSWSRQPAIPALATISPGTSRRSVQMTDKMWFFVYGKTNEGREAAETEGRTPKATELRALGGLPPGTSGTPRTGMSSWQQL